MPDKAEGKMSKVISSAWLAFALQQMAAESYLDGIDLEQY